MYNLQAVYKNDEQEKQEEREICVEEEYNNDEKEVVKEQTDTYIECQCVEGTSDAEDCGDERGE